MIGKLKALTLVLFCLASLETLAADTSELSQADSLFYAKKYTAAFDGYSELFSEDNVSASMLLKMAFIKEGLGDNASSLYYLKQYYRLTSDRAVLTKMNDLATANNLTGYEVGDRHFFLNALLRYATEIQLSLLTVLILMMAFVYRAKKNNQLPVGIPVVQVILLVALFMISNKMLEPKEAVIQEETFLMSGPSAASEPLIKVKKGHLIEILDNSDVWTKIQWEEKEAYIRSSKLRSL